MAGRPKTRQKKIARGECVCPAHDCPIHKTELARATASDTLPSPGSIEWEEMLERARIEAAQAPPPQTLAEAEEQTLNRLLPIAYGVIEEQLSDEDARVRQKAALAPQTVRMTGEQTHTVRYESAAWTWGKEIVEQQGEIEEAEFEEIEEATG